MTQRSPYVLLVPLFLSGFGCQEQNISSRVDASIEDLGGFAENDGSFPNRALLGGRLSGNVPGNRVFIRELSHGEVWDVGNWLNFELWSETDTLWAMVSGAVDTSKLKEDGAVELPAEDHVFLGCAGPESSKTWFDDYSEGTVVVTREEVEVEGGRAVQYTIAGVFPDDETLEARLIVPRR